MNTKEVALLTGAGFSTASKWAKENELERKIVKGILAYEWSEQDVKEFAKNHTGRICRNYK